MKINKKDIKVGMYFKSFDDDDEKWYESMVVEVTDEYVKAKDTDLTSEWEGMLWEIPWDEIENSEMYRK
jgi:hypothetical protein